jgi:hypothetical protein
LITLAGAFEQVLGILDRVEIPYLVVGSVASGSYGLARQTNDIDIVADFRRIDLEAFLQLMKVEFYLDSETAAEAIRLGRSFNAIHRKGAFKFDFFPAGDEGFNDSELRRRRYIISVIPRLQHLEFPISSPEDTILAKLVWFRKGGEVSDRQWHDVLGILRVQVNRLEYGYLTDWANKLGVLNLLHRARSEAERNQI